MTEELEKEFRFSPEDAADFLRDIADSIEEGDHVSLDGDNWKVYQPVDGKVPLRLYSDKKGLSSLKPISSPDRNQK